MLENNHYSASKTCELKLNSIQEKIQSKFNNLEKEKLNWLHYAQVLGIYQHNWNFLTIDLPQTIISSDPDKSKSGWQ